MYIRIKILIMIFLLFNFPPRLCYGPVSFHGPVKWIHRPVALLTVRMVLRVGAKAKKWVVDGAARLLLASPVLLVCRLSLALSSLQRKSFLDSSAAAAAAALTHALAHALWSSCFD
jgi:hypothetical protein